MNVDRLKYNTREKDWISGDLSPDNFALRREFEHLGKSINGIVDALKSNGITEIRVESSRTSASAPGGSGDGGSGSREDPKDAVDLDEKAAVAEGDTPGYLFDKIKAGPGIAIATYPFSGGGSILLIRATTDIEQFVYGFQGRELTLYHPFGNHHYHFHLDKPLSDGSLGPLTYETYKKLPGRLWIRFSGDEFGFVTITGHTGTVQVG